MNSTAQLEELKQLLAQRVGLRVPPDGHALFVKTLHERAARSGYPSLEEYRTFLIGNKAAGEWEEFVRALTSVETFFFRDHGQFDLLRLRLLPELIARHRDDKTLRLWSAGCSSGEEAYSLAMLVDMLLPERSKWNVLILGTDIDSMAIAKARQGCYGRWSFRLFPAAMQQRYFKNAETPAPHSLISDPQVFQLDERIRNMVTFRVGNLLGDPFPAADSYLHEMDLILCRNVFIYFDSAAVPTVAAKFSATLVKGGYLMTAHTELIGHPIKGLESKLFAEGVVYQRQDQPPVCSIANLSPEKAILREQPFGHCAQNNRVSQAAGYLRQAGCGTGTPGQKSTPTLGQVGARQVMDMPSQGRPLAVELSDSARAHADRGEYELAEKKCRAALAADPLAATPYFLLAQLAQIKGDFVQARECLNKTIYLDHRCVAGYLELAALYEREGNMPHAQTLRRTALGIVRSMPNDEQIEQYESTAGELVQWLAQWNADCGMGSAE